MTQSRFLCFRRSFLIAYLEFFVFRAVEYIVTHLYKILSPVFMSKSAVSVAADGAIGFSVINAGRIICFGKKRLTAKNAYIIKGRKELMLCFKPVFAHRR